MDAIGALQELCKGVARGGKYYRRVPTGNPKRPWKYYYTREQYEREHKEAAHIDGISAAEARKPKPARHWVKAAEYGLPSQTIDIHKKGGKYSAERQRLHKRIVSEFVDHVPSVPADQKPVAVVMMGGGGAGKGTIVRYLMGDANDFVNVNSDDCKERLPEYQKALNLGKKNGVPISAKDAAFMAHEESSDIAEQVREQAIAQRKNLVLDGTGKSADKYRKKVQQLIDAGYHVRVFMPHIPLEEAKKRADTRADRSGRYVPHDILEKAHHLIPGNFEAVARSAHEFALFDNTRPPPNPVWTFDGSSENILDKKFVASFRRLAEKRHAVAKQRGWMKSLVTISQSLQKADDKKPSVPLGEMLERMKKKRPEVDSDSTMLDDFMDEMEDHLNEKEPTKKSGDGIDAIAALNSLIKAGPYIGPKGGKWADPKHTISWKDDKSAKKPIESGDASKVSAFAKRGGTGKSPSPNDFKEAISLAVKNENSFMLEMIASHADKMHAKTGDAAWNKISRLANTEFSKMEKSMDAIAALNDLSKAKKAKTKTPHPVSEAQRRWAFAAEARGELPKGKAREWSRRVKGENLPAAKAKSDMFSGSQGRGLGIGKPAGGRGLGPGKGKGPFRGTGLGPRTGECAKATFDMLSDFTSMIGKRTPGIRRALRALAETKRQNVARVARGEAPIVEGKKIGLETFSRRHGAPGSKKEAKERLAAKMTDGETVALIGKMAEFIGKKGPADRGVDENANAKPAIGTQPGDKDKIEGKQTDKGQPPNNQRPKPGDKKQYRTKVESPDKPGKFSFEFLDEKDRPENARFVVSEETPEGAHWEAPEHSEHYEHFKQWKAARKQGLKGTDIPEELVQGAMKHAEKHHYDAGPHKAAYDDHLAHQNSNGAPKPPPSHPAVKNGNGSHPAMRSKDENGKQPVKGKLPTDKKPMIGKMQVPRVVPDERMKDVRQYGVSRSGTERPTVGARAQLLEEDYQALFGYLKRSGYRSTLSKAEGGFHKYTGRKRVGDKWVYEYEHSETGEKKSHENPMDHFHQTFRSYIDPNKKTKDKHPHPSASAHALRPVIEHAKELKPKDRKEVLDQIRGYQKEARTHYRNMDQVARKHDYRPPKDESRRVTRKDAANARAVRDHLETARSHITEAVKTPEQKEKGKQRSHAAAKKYSEQKHEEMKRNVKRAERYSEIGSPAHRGSVLSYREHVAEHKQRFGEEPKDVLPEYGYEEVKRKEAAGQLRLPYVKSMDAIDQLGVLSKAGPYIGPKGGQWADPKHTIPWRGPEHSTPLTRKKLAQAEKWMKESPLSTEKSKLIKDYKMLKANPPRIREGKDVRSGNELYIIEVYSNTVKKYISQGEHRNMKDAEEDLKSFKQDHKETLNRIAGAVRLQSTGKFSGAPGKPTGSRLARSEGSTPMYRQKGDTFELHKGVYAYDDHDGKAKDLPDSYLFEYLAGFVKEAIDSYDCRAKLKALTAGEDIHARAAQEAMYELVQRMPKDKNLMRATKKFKVTQQSIADIIKQRNFIETPSDAKPSGKDYNPAGTYFSTDWDSMTSMGVTSDAGPVGEVMMASQDSPWAQGSPGVKLADEPERQPIQVESGNPFGDIGILQKSQVRADYVDQPVQANVDYGCVIHGTRDLTKEQGFQHPDGICTCKK